MKKFPQKLGLILVASIALGVVGCGESGANTSPDKSELDRFLETNPDLRDNDMTELEEENNVGPSNADIEAELKELGTPNGE
ncbi:hypothetical protein [Rhodopirellula sp. SWK7]|uniref:hypothetical protein n=1 Tax=Rhodopirellula sp. SWK7 TaxID=595460 RepID=UPI0002BE5559|nr:hypothetical protein [Rhodopirellula sp. SWK7]EMI42846.1 secreted protein [Rhodopirellula sp. SWK7]